MAYFSSQITNRILHLTFEDPATRNSFSLTAARELMKLIEESKAGQGFDAVLFSARGRVFCSGGNLADYASMSKASEGKQVNDEIREALSALSSLQVPTVCAVAGDCFGGGVELVSCFDHVIAASHVIFGLWQRKISLTYGWGGGSRLERRLGPARLRSLSLSARAIGSREALEFGLIDEICDETSLIERAFDLARTLTGLPKEPVASLKAFSAETEADLFNSLWWNETHQAVLKSRRK